MAEHIQKLKHRIKSITSTDRVINAMKLVSAAKLRRARNVYEHSQQYLQRIIKSLEESFDAIAYLPKEYKVGSREIKNTGVIVITGSTGFCGSFNNNVVKKAESLVASKADKPKVVTIGTKGRDSLRHRGWNIVYTHDKPADEVTYDECKEMAQVMIDGYRSGDVDEIYIVYTSYVNALTQEPVAKRILPIDLDEHNRELNKNLLVEYDPSPSEVFEYMVEKYLEMWLFSASIESAACEHAARRTTMENASKNTDDMLQDLHVRFNHARQAQITNQLIEIVSGSEAQNN